MNLNASFFCNSHAMMQKDVFGNKTNTVCAVLGTKKIFCAHATGSWPKVVRTSDGAFCATDTAVHRATKPSKEVSKVLIKQQSLWAITRLAGTQTGKTIMKARRLCFHPLQPCYLESMLNIKMPYGEAAPSFCTKRERPWLWYFHTASLVKQRRVCWCHLSLK